MPAFFTEGPSVIYSYTSTNASKHIRTVSVICYTLVYKILLAFLYATYILFYFIYLFKISMTQGVQHHLHATVNRDMHIKVIHKIRSELKTK